MKARVLFAFALAVCFTGAVYAQDAGNPAAAGQNGGGSGRRGGGGFGGGMGRGLTGTVTEAAADHYTIKTDAGDVYTVHLSSDTRIIKRQGGMGGGRGRWRTREPALVRVVVNRAGDKRAARVWAVAIHL